MHLALPTFLAILLATANAHAQRPPPCAPNDALSPARRARHAVESIQRANAVVDADTLRISQLEGRASEGAAWSAYGAGLLDVTELSRVSVCTTDGARRAKASAMQVGGVVGAVHRASGVGIRAQYQSVYDQMAEPTFERDGRSHVGYRQHALAAALTFRHWARLYGGINRPETLARVSSVAMAGEARATMYLKVGF